MTKTIGVLFLSRDHIVDQRGRIFQRVGFGHDAVFQNSVKPSKSVSAFSLDDGCEFIDGHIDGQGLLDSAKPGGKIVYGPISRSFEPHASDYDSLLDHGEFSGAIGTRCLLSSCSYSRASIRTNDDPFGRDYDGDRRGSRRRRYEEANE